MEFSHMIDKDEDEDEGVQGTGELIDDINTSCLDWTNMTREEYSDTDIVIKVATKRCSKVFLYAHEDIRNCRDTIIKIAQQSGEILAYVDNKFKDDNEIVSLCITTYGCNIFKYASHRLKNDEQFILDTLQKKNEYNAQMIKYATHNIISNEQIMLIAIDKNFWAFDHVHPDLKNNKIFIKKAAKKDGRIIILLNDQFANDKELIYACVNSTPSSIRWVKNEYKSDKTLAKIALAEKSNKLRIKQKSYNQQDDFTHIKEYSDGRLIKYLNDDLINDSEIITLSLTNSQWGFEHLNEDKKNNREFILWAIDIQPLIYEFIDEKFKQDFEIINIALKKKPSDTYMQLPINLKNNIEIINQIIKIDCDAVKYIDMHIDVLNDEEFIFNAMKNIDHNIFKYANKRIKLDRELVIKATSIEPTCFQYMTTQFNSEIMKFQTFENKLHDDCALIITLMLFDVNISKFIPRSMKYNTHVKKLITMIKSATNINNENFMEQIIRIDCDAIKYIKHMNIGIDLLNDEDFILNTMKEIDCNIFKYANERIKKDKKLVIKAINIAPSCFQYINTQFNYENMELHTFKNNLYDDIDLAIILMRLDVNASKYLSNLVLDNSNVQTFIKRNKKNKN
jgi:hypothetical protein